MGILKAASLATKRMMLDETDYIEVREGISKRDFNRLAAAMPQNIGENGENMSLADATGFQKFLFTELVIGWSLDSDVTVENYEGLDAAAGAAVDEKVAEHFESLLPTSAEGKSPTT